MNWQDILKDITNRKFKNVYFLQGEEPYFIEQISNALEDQVLTEAEKSFNQTILYGKDVDLPTVLSSARRFPMMSEKQVVIVKEAQHIRDLSSEEGQEMLSNYVENPVPTTILAFCYMNKTLDGRRALSKKLNKSELLFTGKKLYENHIPDWINEYVAAKNLKISPKATMLLSEYLGTNLERLSNEINKILLNIKDGEKMIEDEHVDKYVGVNKDFNVFELQNALMKRNKEKIYKILNYLLQNEKVNPPVLFIGFMYSFLSKLLIVCSSSETNPSTIAQMIGVRPYFAKDYLAARNVYTIAQVIKSITYLSEADAQIKGVGSGTLTNREILKELIFKILHN